MKSPIVVYENGDISVFRSVADAELCLEPIDVRNCEYVAYDSRGCLLDLDVVSECRQAWFGLSKSYIDRVKIEPAEEQPAHASALKGALEEFLLKLGVSDSWVERASLYELLDKTIELVGYG